MESDFFLGYVSQKKSHSNEFVQAKIVTEKYDESLSMNN